ncbi:MAG: hypothetical protein H6558_07190 [Lewinellaceae bacterium]|nr:hypothetical protein [Lewinellaceae bacterium]MCB9287710.1 hypothetical protein [Lewinellaceae bacterium]
MSLRRMFLLAGMLSFVTMMAFTQNQEVEQQVVYVWDFSTHNTDMAMVANRLTEEFETEVTNSGFYRLIEVRELSRVREQIELQKLINDVAELSVGQKGQLQQYQAEAVFFGKLIYDTGNQQYIIEAKLQHLDGRILQKKSLIVNHADLLRNEDLRNHMQRLFYLLHEDRYQARMQKQYALASGKLNGYLRHAKDLSTQVRRVERILDSPEYLEEYNIYITGYDESIRDIMNNHTQYENDFRDAWGPETGRELSAIFQAIIQDFHTPYVFKSLNNLNEEIVNFWANASAKQQKNLREKVLKHRDILQKGLDGNLEQLSRSIGHFLNKLEEKLH